MKVTKRDGSIEEFSSDKIIRVTKAAGLKEDEAKALAQKIEDWFIEKKLGKATSLQVRDRVLIELTKVDEYAANMYSWYQKSKTK